MRVLNPSRSEDATDDEIRQIIDLGAHDGQPAMLYSGVANETIGYMRTSGQIAAHRGYSYEWSVRDCCFITLHSGDMYVTSRAGIRAYLCQTHQPAMVELDDE